MAAWLAFLKSRLLLPEPPSADGPSAEEMATALANRLRRLEAIREAAEPADEPAAVPARYLSARQSGSRSRKSAIRNSPRRCSTCSPPMPRSVSSACWRPCIWPSARSGRLPRRAPRWSGWSACAEDWSCLDEFLMSYVVDPSQRATVFASSFAAALELVREGAVELNQKEAFAPLYFRKRPPQQPPMRCRAGRSGRVSGRRRPSHGKPGGKTRGRAEERPADPQARPEELRLLEALLFASAEPLDQATLPSACPTASTSRRRWRSCRRTMPRAASIWCASPTNGPSVPPAICRG